MYKLAIFDFDGTLADSFPFFLSVYNDLARRHGFGEVAPDEVDALRRLGAREIMRRVGMPAWKLPRVAGDFIGRMRERRHTIPLFAGAAELLVRLQQTGTPVGIVSSNARDNVVAILGAPAAAAVSHFACGMSIFGKRAHLREVLERTGVRRSEAIYVGDHTTDLEAAHAEGLAFGAVAWGYGDVAALQAAGAEHSFCSMGDIAGLFRLS